MAKYVATATEGLDDGNRLAPRGHSRHKRPTGTTGALKNARWALWRNPDNLTGPQREQPAWIAKTNPVLYRAWPLKARAVHRVHDR
jgi:transposase